jgi:hypothetical protein
LYVKPPVIRRFISFCVQLFALFAVVAGLTASARKAAPYFAPSSSQPSKPLTPATIPIVAVNPVVTSPRSDTPEEAQVQENYGKLPLSFEANRGQINDRVKFFSRGSGYNLFLTSTDAVMALLELKVRTNFLVRATTLSETIRRSGEPMYQLIKESITAKFIRGLIWITTATSSTLNTILS